MDDVGRCEFGSVDMTHGCGDDNADDALTDVGGIPLVTGTRYGWQDGDVARDVEVFATLDELNVRVGLIAVEVCEFGHLDDR